MNTQETVSNNFCLLVAVLLGKIEPTDLLSEVINDFVGTITSSVTV